MGFLIFLCAAGAVGALVLFVVFVGVRQRRRFREALSVLPVQETTINDVVGDDDLVTVFAEECVIPHELLSRLPVTCTLGQLYDMIKCEATAFAILALQSSIRGAGYDFNGDLSLVTKHTLVVDFLKEFSPWVYDDE